MKNNLLNSFVECKGKLEIHDPHGGTRLYTLYYECAWCIGKNAITADSINGLRIVSCSKCFKSNNAFLDTNNEYRIKRHINKLC